MNNQITYITTELLAEDGDVMWTKTSGLYRMGMTAVEMGYGW